MEEMKPSEYVAWQVPMLGLFAVLFALSTAYLRTTNCVEGGTVIGFPWYFYIQCSISVGALGRAEFLLVSLVVDVVFWYLVSMMLVFVGVGAYRRLRG